jgi:hypothetical protein
MGCRHGGSRDGVGAAVILLRNRSQ